MQVVDLPASPISTSSDLYGQCELPALPSALSAMRMQACYKQPEIGTPISAPRPVPARRITITADSKSGAEAPSADELCLIRAESGLVYRLCHWP